MLRIALLLAFLALVPRAQAAPPPSPPSAADLALVLVDDVSGSINDDEFDLQKKGYGAAFTDPNVLAAIRGGPAGAIVVAYVEFAANFQVRTVVDWTVIHDEASARAFVTALDAAPRSYRGRTAIGAGIDEAMQELGRLPLPVDRRIIDVCGDGTSNSGRPVTEARDDAVAKGVTINGLAIANESDVPWLQAHTHPPGGLDNYYRENVTGGEGSFVMQINHYEAFAEAVKRKLLQEIASATRPRPGATAHAG